MLRQGVGRSRQSVLTLNPTTARCIDTYVALSVSQNPPQQTQEQDKPTFQPSANGSANTSASLTSTTTPFSQSTLPSKSLLSRETSSSLDPSLTTATNGSVLGLPTASLSKATQKSLQNVIRRIFERCFQEGAYRHVVGIAVEARSLDILRETISRASNDSGKHTGKGRGSQSPNSKREELMDYLLDICMNVIQERQMRNEVWNNIDYTNVQLA